MKIIIYTINLNGYDEPHPIKPEKGVKYLYYTDADTAPSGWKHMKMKGNCRRCSRHFKINSHLLPKHDVSIYIDACLIIKKDLTPLIKTLKSDIGISKHPFDHGIYVHADRCAKLNLDDRDVIYKYLYDIQAKGMPYKYGLTENCLIIRKNTAKIKKLNRLWWKEYCRGSQRDQLSLPFALWKTGVKVTPLPIEPYDRGTRENDYYTNWGNHLRSRTWNN
jgi:hypothetical protein